MLAIICRQHAAKPAVVGQVHRVVGPRPYILLQMWDERGDDAFYEDYEFIRKR